MIKEGKKYLFRNLKKKTMNKDVLCACQEKKCWQYKCLKVVESSSNFNIAT